LAATLTTLVNGVTLTPNIAGPLLDPLLGSGVAATVKNAVGAALSSALPLLIPAVDQALASAGLRVGDMDIRATSVRCGIPALVN
jgi:uncharacterized membrane protein